MSDPIDPKHYNQLAIQPRDYITKNHLGYNEGNIVKYISRWRLKGGLNDLKKAQNYINYLIKLVEEHQKKTQAAKARPKPKPKPNWDIDGMLKAKMPEEDIIELVGQKFWDEWNKKKKKKPDNVVDFKKDPKK